MRPPTTLAAIVVVATLLLALTPTALAHPGRGIAIGPDHSVVFTDIGHLTIWELPPGADTPRPIATDRWTHHLCFATDATLYYEREVPRPGQRAYRALHKRTPDGVDHVLIAPTLDADVFDAGPIAVDVDHNVYFTRITPIPKSPNITRIFRRAPDGAVSHFCGHDEPPFPRDGDPTTATFGLVTDMAIAPDGNLYVLEHDSVRIVTPDGDVTTLATDLLDAKPADPPYRRGPSTTVNRLYGICVDGESVVHVAYHAGRRVIRIEPGGKTSIAYTSRRPWAPIGVATRDAILYILEDGHEPRSTTHGPRVRRLNADGSIDTLTTIPD